MDQVPNEFCKDHSNILSYRFSFKICHLNITSFWVSFEMPVPAATIFYNQQQCNVYKSFTTLPTHFPYCPRLFKTNRRVVSSCFTLSDNIVSNKKSGSLQMWTFLCYNLGPCQYLLLDIDAFFVLLFLDGKIGGNEAKMTDSWHASFPPCRMSKTKVVPYLSKSGSTFAFFFWLILLVAPPPFFIGI